MRSAPKALVGIVASVALLALTACESSNDDPSSAGSDSSALAEKEGTNSGGSGSGSTDESDAGSGQDAGTAGSDGRTSDESDSSGEPNSSDSGDRVAPQNDDVLPDGRAQSPVLNQLPGSRSGACVDTAGMRNARSGSIAAGPFDEVDGSYGSKRPGKPADSIRLYWIPMHGHAPGLTVRVTKAGGPTKTVTENHVSDTDQWRFYDTNIPIDSPGTWTLRASSGGDSGCFKVTVS